jgi:hypothetical protein
MAPKPMIAAVLLLLASCGGGGGGSSSSPTSTVAAPPPISKAEAYRFLNQATFGATETYATTLIG